jgi:epoxyqueuosine reductase QueG
MPPNHSTSLAAWIESLITDFIDRSPLNTLENSANDRAFKTPLVGFSSGGDQLYEAYKEYVGDFHWTPKEAFENAFPSGKVNPEELTVVSWILPHIDATKVDNRKQEVFPAERWARGRIFGEKVNEDLRIHVVNSILAKGYEAVAPVQLSQWSREKSQRYVFASKWSERHAAHAAGLGTFGLCDGLITPLGKAMRTGSVIARLQIPPTSRPYSDHRAYCLFFSQGTCGKCIDRCPVGALSEAGHDKIKCLQHLSPATADYVKENYGFDGYGCGLCQTGVPCESKIPINKDLEPPGWSGPPVRGSAG